MLCQYYILRSDAVSPHVLNGAIAALRSKHARQYLDAWTKNKLDGIELIGNQLRDLAAFQTASNVAVRAGALGAEGNLQLEKLLHLCDSVDARAGGLIWIVLQRSRAVQQNGRFWSDSDLSLGAGLGADGYHVWLQPSSSSSNYKDNVARREMFRKAIEVWGLQTHVEIESRNGDFMVSAEAPLRIRYRHIPTDNLNPKDLQIEGLNSLDFCIAAARSVRDVFANQVLSTTFGCALTRDQYGQVYKKFNVLWKGWNVEVRGTITAEAEDILNGGELTETSPSWIPAMRWHEDDLNAVILVSVIIENGQRYLEIATDGGTLEMLQDRVAFLSDLHFVPVFP
jgi:hypothetical protein